MEDGDVIIIQLAVDLQVEPCSSTVFLVSEAVKGD